MRERGRIGASKNLTWLGLSCLLILGLVAGCGSPTSTVAPTAVAQPTVTVAIPATTAATTAAATTSAATTAALTTAAATTPPATTVEAEPTPVVVPPGSFQNPVFQKDFPDPFVLKVGDLYYAYATNGSGRNIQMATSKDLVNWELQSDAMPALPSWAKFGGSLVWAPEVLQLGSDKFIMYYTARDKASNKQCIGLATSDKPDGKFKDSRDAPFVCQSEEGGTIDSNVFRDGDKLYLYYKNDGNCCAQTTYIYAQELAPDGLSLLGKPVQLVKNDAGWEGAVVEAPSMVKRDGQYYLFFSANSYAGLDYAVGYATCKSALGPCEDAAENPILKTALKKPPVIGPGHQTLVQIGDEIWIIYHSWEVSNGVKTTQRFMWLDKLTWKDGKPQVQGPTTDPQPAPKLKP